MAAKRSINLKTGRPKAKVKRAKKYPKAGRKVARRQNSSKPGSKGKLTPKFMLVIDEYMTNGYNQFAALTSAGYSYTVARFNPGTVFERPEVKHEVECRFKELRAKYKLTEEFIIQNLMQIAGANPGHIIAKLKANGWDITKLSIEDRQSIDGMTEEVYMEGRGDEAVAVKKVKTTGISSTARNAALAQLAKIAGINAPEKMEHSASGDLADLINAGRARVAKGVD